MSLHKLSAGHGYDYLIRQVAALDATHRGRTSLASYYDERGEAPGSWVGRGLDGIDGLAAGDVVTSDQMRLLFADGRHPLAEVTSMGAKVPRRILGLPFRRSSRDRPFKRELNTRIAEHNTALGRPVNAGLPADLRARLRTDLASIWFQREHGRAPKAGVELTSALAQWSRPPAAAVGGYDLTFSPVKSVSTLWAVADPTVAAQIEHSHNAAVAQALRFIEDRALFTREGRQGVRQVDVTGLVAVAFTHRDSRAGDPDLHTHVAVANKVQTLGGRWLSIDGRVLHAAAVAASETYNTALEQHLTATLGVRFVERPGQDGSKQQVREILGVDPRLNRRWSTRRHAINDRRAELAGDFTKKHGRTPTRVETFQLAQQATLETRDRKHEPRTLTEQRGVWMAEAIAVLGGRDQVGAMLYASLNPSPPVSSPITTAWIEHTAGLVLASVEERRATWQPWHLWAEAQRQLRGIALDPADLIQVAQRLVDEAVGRSVRLSATFDRDGEPADLRRSDGASVYTVAGADQYTSTRVLSAEQRLLEAADRSDGRTLDPATAALGLAGQGDGPALDAGQAAMVQTVATHGRRLQLVIAPAGAGKTTALQVLARTWTAGGGHIFGLAPSAAAAAQLSEATGIATDTLARLTWALHRGQPLPDWARQIGPMTLLLVDEAGMADTFTLDTAVGHVLRQGGRVCLVGDDRQLGAVGAGGILTNLDAAHGAIRLSQLHRFDDPGEAAATLLVREGQAQAAQFYLERGRIRAGDIGGLPDQVVRAWRDDRDRGVDALMLAPSRRQVADLNQRARAERISDLPADREVGLADGNQASIGDVIITRRNDRRIACGSGWVRNGDRWTVTDLAPDGGLVAVHIRTGRPVNLSGGYVTEAVELGYATTIHTAQGVTSDTTHGLVDELMTREQLYTMLSRGRAANHLYVGVGGNGDPHILLRAGAQEDTVAEVLQQILRRSSLPVSATTVLNQQNPEAARAQGARSVHARHRQSLDPAPPDHLPAAAPSR